MSLFFIIITLAIFGKYQLRQSIFFALASLAIFTWNLLHLFFNLIGEDSLDFEIIRLLWLVMVFTSIIFVYSMAFGYSLLRFENINYRLVIYAILGTITMMLFIFKPNWVNVVYTQSDGWVTEVKYDIFWIFVSLSIVIINLIEIIIPLFRTYRWVNVNKNSLLIMFMGIMLAILSNSMEPLLDTSNLPQAIRFLMANIGFLLFFIVLLRYPFTVMFDTTSLTQIIAANSNGVPFLTFSKDHGRSVLASGAIVQINTILEETVAQDLSAIKNTQLTRKIELGIDQFYIIIRGYYILIFQFKNPTGICYSKFLSLGKIFSFEFTSRKEHEEQAEEFVQKLSQYFENTQLKGEASKILR